MSQRLILASIFLISASIIFIISSLYEDYKEKMDHRTISLNLFCIAISFQLWEVIDIITFK